MIAMRRKNAEIAAEMLRLLVVNQHSFTETYNANLRLQQDLNRPAEVRVIGPIEQRFEAPPPAIKHTEEESELPENPENPEREEQSGSDILAKTKTESEARRMLDEYGDWVKTVGVDDTADNAVLVDIFDGLETEGLAAAEELGKLQARLESEVSAPSADEAVDAAAQSESEGTASGSPPPEGNAPPADDAPPADSEPSDTPPEPEPS